MTSLEEASRRLNDALARLEGTLKARVEAERHAGTALERLKADNARLLGLNAEVAGELDGAIRRLRAVLGD